jgi:3-hydroxybutyryl-CoA dehydratase
VAAIAVGDVRTYTRTFTEEDVRLFARVSRDEGVQHMQADEQGRLWVHGLLTATLPTKLGGDLSYLARTMDFEFVRPVFVGDTIECRTTCVSAHQEPGRLACSFEVVCVNQHGKDVLRARSSGVILDRD